MAHWLLSTADVLDARFKTLKDFDWLTGWTETNKMTFNRDKDNPVFRWKKEKNQLAQYRMEKTQPQFICKDGSVYN